MPLDGHREPWVERSGKGPKMGVVVPGRGKGAPQEAWWFPERSRGTSGEPNRASGGAKKALSGEKRSYGKATWGVSRGKGSPGRGKEVQGGARGASESERRVRRGKGGLERGKRATGRCKKGIRKASEASAEERGALLQADQVCRMA